MKRFKSIFVIIIIAGSFNVFAQNTATADSISQLKNFMVLDTNNILEPIDTSTITHEPLSITTAQGESNLNDTLNRDYECLYNSCSEILNNCKEQIQELNEKLVSLQTVINSLWSTDSSSIYAINIDNIDNLPVNIIFQNKSYSVYIVNPHKNEINLYNEKDKGGYYDFISINQRLESQGKVLLFAMNAGMYQQNREPEGLFINDGEELQKINLKKKIPGQSNFYNLRPNGVFAIDKINTPYIVRSEDFPELEKRSNISFATQSGPMLIINGEINTYFTKGSSNLNIRNGVGINKSGKVVFVISNEPVNFYEFSELFKDGLKCNNALYLDGVISRMYLPELNKTSLQNSNHLGPIITVEK